MRKSILPVLILSILGQVNCVYEFVDAFVPSPDLPVKVYAQDTWITEKPEGLPENLLSERQAVIDCLQQWNDATEPFRKAGAPKPFEFKAFISVPDFEVRSLDDQMTVIYRVPEISPELGAVFKAGHYLDDGHFILGYGLPENDALIFLGEFENHLGWNPEPGLPAAKAILLSQVICHELGHVLGVQHHHEFGDMNVAIPWDGWGGSDRYVTDADARAFRLVHPDDYR